MYTKVVTLSHDGFARYESIRRIIYTERKCAWCGQNHRHRLFQYGISPDSIGSKNYWDDREFCSKPCRDALYDRA